MLLAILSYNFFAFSLEEWVIQRIPSQLLALDKDFRGQKIAQKLISHLKSLSKANNWNGIRWITHSSNENAKKLYDKIANNTGFELYELKGN